jgi:hypothetical protein
VDDILLINMGAVDAKSMASIRVFMKDAMDL